MPELAANDSPPIVISYHASDEEWKDRLIFELRAAEQYRMWFDRVDGKRRGQVDVKTIAVLKNAKVLVLLLSPSYLNSTWVADEKGYVLLGKNGPHIVGLIVQNTTKEQLSTLPSSYIPVNATPLQEATTDTANAILGKVPQLLTAF